jgi:hypothetical protein
VTVIRESRAVDVAKNVADGRAQHEAAVAPAAAAQVQPDQAA